MGSNCSTGGEVEELKIDELEEKKQASAQQHIALDKNKNKNVCKHAQQHQQPFNPDEIPHQMVKAKYAVVTDEQDHDDDAAEEEEMKKHLLVESNETADQQSDPIASSDSLVSLLNKYKTQNKPRHNTNYSTHPAHRNHHFNSLNPTSPPIASHTITTTTTATLTDLEECEELDFIHRNVKNIHSTPHTQTHTNTHTTTNATTVPLPGAIPDVHSASNSLFFQQINKKLMKEDDEFDF